MAVAVVGAVLITATSAVAGVPTTTERLLGKRAATNGVSVSTTLATKASETIAGLPPLKVRSGPTITEKEVSGELVCR